MFMTKMSRHMCRAALVIARVSAPAGAQEGLRSASLPERNLRTPDPAAPADLFRATPSTYGAPDPRFPRNPRRSRFRGDLGLFPSFFAPWGPYGLPVEAPLEEEIGYLLPQVMPGTTEVLVDGLAVGTVDDLRRTGRGHPLDPGAHAVELRAPGYRSVSASVRVAPGETVMYRRDLEVAPRPEAAPPPPGVPKTFYVIPGCYAGDRPPESGRLPPNCDAANVRTIPPQAGTIRVTGGTPAPGR
jgi:hypothetical protein